LWIFTSYIDELVEQYNSECYDISEMFYVNKAKEEKRNVGKARTDSQ
jgi:hypothetical protein